MLPGAQDPALTAVIADMALTATVRAVTIQALISLRVHRPRDTLAARRRLARDSWGHGLTETSLALVGCVVVLVVAIILDRQPYRPGKLNYIPLMIVALAAILVLARHLLALVQ